MEPSDFRKLGLREARHCSCRCNVATADERPLLGHLFLPL